MYFIISLFWFVFSSFVFSQQANPPKQETIVFKTWGLPYVKNDPSCEDSLQASYGFKYTSVAGCEITTEQERRWTSYNKRMEKIMEDRHGKNWRLEYYNALNKCEGYIDE